MTARHASRFPAVLLVMASLVSCVGVSTPTPVGPTPVSPSPVAAPSPLAVPIRSADVGGPTIALTPRVTPIASTATSPLAPATSAASSATSAAPPLLSSSPRPSASLQPLPSLEPVPSIDPGGPRPYLSKEVVAYLPYWVATSTDVPYDPATDPYIVDSRLTDLVLFSIGIRRNGSLKLDTPGATFVLSPRAAAIITQAHARGIRVLVSFTSGGYENNARLFGSQAAMDRFVAEATALVQARGLDGADMDVELIDGAWFDAYAATAGRLKTALTDVDPAARVMVATNGNRSGARMAKRSIAKGVDRAFLMGYAYRGPTSSLVGSIAPLGRADDGLDLRDSLALYQDRGVPLDQVIIGLPAYGLTWATLGPELHAERAPARVSERGRVTLFRDAATGSLPSGAVQDEDPVESSARLTWYDAERGSWFQTYYDTPATLRAKYVLALVAHTAGVGIWTLGYDAGLPGYPALVGQVFSQPVVGSVTVEPVVGSSLDVRLSATTYDGPAATDGVRVSNDGLRWSPWLDAATLDPARKGPKAWRLAVGPDGDRNVWVQSRDVDGALSTQVTATVLVDRAPPLIEGFSLRPAPVPGWIGQYVALDEGGIATTEIRWRVGTGDWTDWRLAESLAAGSVMAAPDQAVQAQLRVTDRAGHVTMSTTEVSGGWTRP